MLDKLQAWELRLHLAGVDPVTRAYAVQFIKDKKTVDKILMSFGRTKMIPWEASEAVVALALKLHSWPSFALDAALLVARVYYGEIRKRKRLKLTDEQRYLLNMLKTDRLKEQMDRVDKAHRIIYDQERLPQERFKEMTNLMLSTAVPYCDAPLFAKVIGLWGQMIHSFTYIQRYPELAQYLLNGYALPTGWMVIAMSKSSEDVPVNMAAVIQFDPWTVEMARQQGKTIDQLSEELLRSKIAEALRRGESLWSQYSGS